MNRRFEDVAVRVCLARMTAGPMDEPGQTSSRPQILRDTLRTREGPGGAIELDRWNGTGPDAGTLILFLDDALGRGLIAAAVSSVTVEAGGDVTQLVERSVREILVEHRNRARAAARIAGMQRMVLFAEHLARQHSLAAIHQALADQVPQILRVHEVLLFVAEPEGRLVPHDSTGAGRISGSLPPEALAGLESGGLFTRETLEADESALRQIGALLEPFPDGRLACVSIGREALLILVERRADRELDPEEWFWLRSIARQTEAALERVRLREPAA